MRSLFLLLAVSAMVAVGCADSPTGVADRSALLVGSWNTAAYHVQSKADSFLLFFADTFIFQEGGSYTTKSRFDSTSNPAFPGTWRFISNGRQLVMDAGTTYQAVWTIVGLTATSLHMTTQLNVNDVLVDVDYYAVR